MLAIQETQWLLEQWGTWVNKDGVMLKASSPFGLGSTVSEAQITDDAAMAVDKVLLALKRSEKNLYRAVYRYYRYKLDDRRLARSLKIPMGTARYWRRNGERWVDGALTGVTLAE